MKKKMLCLLACLLGAGVFAGEYPIINVGVDLTAFGVAAENIRPSAEGDQTKAFQAVVDHIAGKGGGIALVPPGVYRVNKLVIRPGVELVGGGRGKTVFRASDSGDVFLMEGGAVRGFTVYGTPDEKGSGDNWYVGTGGIGKGGTARALNLIALREPKDRVTIDNIEALEARYDCLYVRNCNGLTVTNSHFDRAGRNIFSMVGNSDKFIFSGCYFGSYWGLYHSDIEPNKAKWVKNGLIADCVFDGRDAGGKRGCDSWGRMFTFSGMGDQETRNIAVFGNKFEQISVRIRGSFPLVQFLDNEFNLKGLNTAFLQVRTNKGAVLPDFRLVGNRFEGISGDRVIYNVSITGEPVIRDNNPEVKYSKAEAPKDSSWQEDHPSVLQGDRKIEVKTDGGVTFVKMPLMGYEYNFASGKAMPGKQASDNDLSMHVDPLLTLGKAEFSRSAGFDAPDLSALSYGRQLWNVKPGDVLVVRTNAGKTAVMEILGLGKQDISFRYRFL
jgi:hypothetical protein